MRTVPLPIIRELLFGVPALIDLIEAYVTGGVQPDLRFALFDQNVVWNNREYIAAGARTPVRNRQSISDSLGELVLLLPDVNKTIAAVLENADAIGTVVLVRRVLRSRLDSSDSVVFYRGKIKAPVVVEAGAVAITLMPMCADPDELITFPGRSYGVPCGYRRFGGPECNVDLVPFTYEGELDGGSNVVTLRDAGVTQDVIDDLSTKSGVDANGDDIISPLPAVVKFTSGMNEGAVRPVSVIRPCVVELRRPLLSLPEAGDTYELQRRCPRTADACEGFGNMHRHGGFTNSPKEPRDLRRELLR